MAEGKGAFIVEENSILLYLKEISKLKPLKLKDEAELAVKIRKGDTFALEKLVKANLRFVVSVARNYQNQGLPLTDLINEGNLGLIRAAKRFDETKKFKFISYAVWWVRQAILQALAEHSRIVKLPLNRVGTIYKIGKTAELLEQTLGRVPTADEIAKDLKLDVSEVRATVSDGNNHMSLNAPIQSGDKSTLMDVLKDDGADSPDEKINELSLSKELEQTLTTLSQKEENVIKLYYGIGVENSHTLEEIGYKFNLTRERVRQIKEKALKRLKHSSRNKNLRNYAV